MAFGFKLALRSIAASAAVMVGLGLHAGIPPALADDPKPYPRISREEFLARLPFFEAVGGSSVEGRMVRQWEQDTSTRRKFVFRGAQGFLVPGLIETPKEGKQPWPTVLLLHGWSGSKDDWWRDDGYLSGGLMRKALLKSGYAVVALDAATHGDRSSEIDFQHVNPFEDPKAPPQRSLFSFAEIAVQTVKDHRRCLDFLIGRGEIDPKRIGLVGYSMGGMNAFYLLSVEPRIKAAVACVPPLQSAGYGPASPVDYTWGVGAKPLLMLMGKKDELGDFGRVSASYERYIKGRNTEIRWFDSGHKLPPEWTAEAITWLRPQL